ncbi:MAG: hypothetical protein Q7S65_02215 [Nanoarchaeota archaeon]|nr:hypothetical protein [Nanoarchaeota archaeon]
MNGLVRFLRGTLVVLFLPLIALYWGVTRKVKGEEVVSVFLGLGFLYIGAYSLLGYLFFRGFFLAHLDIVWGLILFYAGCLHLDIALQIVRGDAQERKRLFAHMVDTWANGRVLRWVLGRETAIRVTSFFNTKLVWVTLLFSFFLIGFGGYLIAASFIG